MKLFPLTFLMLCLSERTAFSKNNTKLGNYTVSSKLANYTVVGKPTTIQKYPSLVYLGRCVGVLVSPLHILTAGHCIHIGRKMFTASVGHTHKLSGSRLTIAKVYRHPKFTRAKNRPNFDIALLKLDSPVSLSDHVDISQMAKPTDVFAPGTLCMVAGWGSLSRSKIKTSSQLHKATMKIAKPSECTFKRFHFDVKSELCLKSIPGINQAAAPGDSGAPLWCPRQCDHKLVIAGVDSRGILPDLKQSLDIFTKVSYHRKWIDHFMKTTK